MYYKTIAYFGEAVSDMDYLYTLAENNHAHHFVSKPLDGILEVYFETLVDGKQFQSDVRHWADEKARVLWLSSIADDIES